jgi:hypothetical protein
MKKVLCSFAMAVALQAGATIRTVSNNPNSIAQFSTVQAAVDAAVSGDTILVHGSPNVYQSFTINNKQLVVIGPGWSPNKTLPLTATFVGSISIGGSTASGTELHGLDLNATVNITSGAVNNLRFIRNHIYRNFINLTPSGASGVSGYRFESNWFENGGVATSSFYTNENIIFVNNIFYDNAALINGNIQGFTNSVNILFDHNLWYGPGSGNRNAFANNCRFLTLSNNVFVRRNAANHLSGSTFYNNITYLTGNDLPWTQNSNLDGGSNVAGTDPQMVTQTDVNNGVNNPLLDFSIAAGPANNSGSDGKDMGLLYENVGSLNWTNSRTSRLPYIYSMQTNTPTVVPGGSITVTVEARTSN